MAGYNEDVNINLNILAGAMGGITAIMGGMSALTSTFGQFGTAATESFGTIDGLLVSATALIGTFGVQSAEAFGEFEQGMKIVQAVSGQTGAAISELGNQANRLSVEYRTAIGDITEGLQTLGRAGLNSAESQLEVLESGLQTAKLEGRNLNSVLEELIQNTAMLGGNLDAIDFGSQTEYVNSLLVGTSMTAPINSHDISQTLQYVGGTAAAAGANLEDKEKLEDLMGTIAAFAQKGVTGSMAGTALRAFLTKPASQDKSVVEGLSAIGLSPEDLWEQGGESMKDISDQIELIKLQMDRLNLSTMDQLEIWGKIVGPKMGQQMMKLDADRIDELKGNIQEAASAEELATSTLNSYNQKINEMTQLGQAAFREFGSKVVLYLTPIVEAINTVLSLLSNPVINTAVFGAVFIVVSHGLQAAAGMIRSIIAQIRQTLTAVENVVGAASGITPQLNSATASASLFKNEIYAILEGVGLLNTNIAQTGTLTGAMQAHLLGKSGKGFIAGYPGEKTLPRNVVGYSDNYTQYFSKPTMSSNYTAYHRAGRYGAFPISEDTMKSLSTSDRKILRRLVEKSDGKLGGYVFKNPDRLLSQKDYNKLSDDARRLFQAKTISDSKYSNLDPRQQQYYTKGTPFVTSHGMDYLSTDKYNALSKEERKGFKGQNYRLMARFGTADELKREIESSTSKLRTFQGTTAQWNALSEEERDAHRQATKKFREIKAKELEESAVPAGARRDGKQIYGYTTMHNIPQKETLAQMMSRQGAEGGKAMVAAFNKEFAQDLRKGAIQNMGIGGRLRFTGVDKMNAAVGRITKGADLIGRGFGKVQNTLDRGYNSIRSGWTTVKNKITSDGKGVGTTLRSVATSITSEKGKVRTAIQGFVNNVKTASRAGFKWTAIQSFNGMLDSAKMKLAGFASSVGITTGTMHNLQTNAMAVMGATSGMQMSFESVESLMAYLSEELGISTKEFANLVLTTEELTLAFGQLASETTAATAAETQKALGNVASEAGMLSKGFSSVIGLMGGPFMAAMLGFTLVTQVVNSSMQEWQKTLQEATNQMSEATSAMEDAANNIKETFKKENPELTESQLEQIVDYQYGSIGEILYRNSYDDEGRYQPVVTGHSDHINLDKLGRTTVGDGIEVNAEGVEESIEGVSITQDENIKALNENTVALAEATNAYNQAQNKTVNAMTDAVWGFNSYGSNFTDFLGEAQEALWNFGSFGNGIDTREGFLSNKSPVLTGSQKDSNYGGSKEFAGVFSADVYRFGVEKGLEQFFGSDYDRIISLMKSIDAGVAEAGLVSDMKPYETLMAHANNFKAMDDNGNIDYQTAALMQTQLSQNKTGYQRLGRQMYEYEKQYSFSPYHTAYGDWQKGYKREHIGSKQKRDKNEYKALSKEKLTVQDKNLDNTIKKLMAMSDNKLSYANVLAMGQLQQLQDMYQVANEQVAPGIEQTVQQVASNVMATNGAAANAGEAGSGAISAANNAATIAAFLGANAQGVAEKSGFKEYLRDSDEKHKLAGVDTEEEFVKAISSGNSEAAKYWRGRVYETLGGASYSLNNPGASAEEVKEAGKRLSSEVQRQQIANHTNYQDALNTLTKPIVSYAEGAVKAAYEASDIGTYGKDSNPSGSGGGGDSGSGKGDKDSGEKNTKNRVDLVLCNKKEIPKLNVNLFKKEPNFTILNKNFKLRDIKINTQDTPKSILDAVKNGIIDTAKRMDPKIIQDGESVYDPVGATEGTDTPSGTTPSTSE